MSGTGYISALRRLGAEVQAKISGAQNRSLHHPHHQHHIAQHGARAFIQAL